MHDLCLLQRWRSLSGSLQPLALDLQQKGQHHDWDLINLPHYSTKLSATHSWGGKNARFIAIQAPTRPLQNAADVKYNAHKHISLAVTQNEQISSREP